MILVCGQNCAWQLIYRFERVTAGAVNRVLEVQRAAAGKGIKVARALTALGLPATLLAYLGGANGRRMRAALRDEGSPRGWWRRRPTPAPASPCWRGRRGGGAVAAPLRLEHTDLAGAARLAAACGSANCRSVVPGLVTRDLVRQLAAQVTIAESRP